jgi:dimethylsulfone monooxygenase
VVEIRYTEPVKFSYWAPLGSGGFVVSRIEQRTGFDYALMPARYFTSHGWAEQFEAVTTSAGLTQHTDRITILSALHPGLWHPGIVAKMGATIDHMSGGRWGLNITTGWFKDEFSFAGDFYRIHDAPLRPKPLRKTEIFQGGNSIASRNVAAKVSNLLFLNGHTITEASAIVQDVKQRALEAGRVVKGIHPSQEGSFGCGMNCFIICRDTEAEARDVFRDIVAHADWDSIREFEHQVKTGAGKSSAEGVGMWADSRGTDFVQQNDGFRPDLIGTPEQIADKIEALHSAGIDLIQCGFLHYEEDLANFGEKVIPLVREREAKLAAGEPFRVTGYESDPESAPAR